MPEIQRCVYVLRPRKRFSNFERIYSKSQQNGVTINHKTRYLSLRLREHQFHRTGILSASKLMFDAAVAEHPKVVQNIRVPDEQHQLIFKSALGQNFGENRKS